MQQKTTGAPVIRLAELMAALSLATDLGMGQPLEHALCSCVLAVRLGESLGLDEEALREVYYLALLHHIGCTADTYRMAALFGDELMLRTDAASVDSTQALQAISMLVRNIRRSNEGASPVHLARKLAQGILTSASLMKEEYAGFCEVAERLAGRLGFDERILQALLQPFERWDGKGAPNGLKGEEIARPVRIVTLAQDIITFQRLNGLDAAVAIAQARKGSAYDPQIVECFCRRASPLLAGLEEEPSWERVLALEPGRHVYLAEEQFDTACQAIADFVDLKSPYTLGHSSGVAELSAGAALRPA